jgi:hypothetical protein
MESSTDPKPKKQRKQKPLPSQLLSLSEKDFGYFEIVTESDDNPKSVTYGKELEAVRSVTVPPHDTVDLTKLTLDQLRALCRILGVRTPHTLNKYECRVAVARHIRVSQGLEEAGITPQLQQCRLTSTICRAVNVCFSDQFIERFEAVNDLKNRVDHESNNTHKDFWIAAADAHNSMGKGRFKGLGDLEGLDSEDEGEDDFVDFIVPPTNEHLAELLNNKEYDLSDVDQYSSSAFRMKILTLFKVRRAMKENMTMSGTHDNDAWNFVEVAMRGHSGLTKLAVYYFYMRCESHPGIDARFQPFLDSALKGSSVQLDRESPSSLESGSARGSATKRQKREEQLDRICEHMERHYAFMEREEERHKEQKEYMKKNSRIEQIKARIDIAKALNDMEGLRALAAELKELDA